MNLDEAKKLLIDSGNYKVLERYQYKKIYEPNTKNEPTEIACVVDTETTGLRFDEDDVINIGLVRFEYGLDTGTIYQIVEMFDDYQDSRNPIPPAIQDLTGIKPDMIKGKTFDNERISRMIDESAFMIAHSAPFDRGMIDPRWKVSQGKIWYDTLSQVPWKALGAQGQRLSDAAMLFGFFFEGHRALADALATLHVLAQKVNDVPVMKILKTIGGAEFYICNAWKAPYSGNAALRNGNFRFNTKDKVWSKFVPASSLAEEESYLKREVYNGAEGYVFHPLPRVDLFKS